MLEFSARRYNIFKTSCVSCSSSLFWKVSHTGDANFVSIFEIWWGYYILVLPCCTKRAKSRKSWRFLVQSSSSIFSVFRVVTNWDSLWKNFCTNSSLIWYRSFDKDWWWAARISQLVQLICIPSILRLCKVFSNFRALVNPEFLGLIRLCNIG